MDGASGDSGDENHIPPKKMKTAWSVSYSNKALDMMYRMGFDDDKGLGKMSQGRLEPVVAVQQGGRRGLGAESLFTDETWDFDSEQINIPEPVVWVASKKPNFPFAIEQLKSWARIDRKKDIIDDEVQFCDESILSQMLAAKHELDKIDGNDMRRARSRCNPFETIRSSIFLNRAAVKMANMDSLCDFMFTKLVDPQGFSLTKDDLCYFADICAGPGGFSEYILYRKKWEAKGFGFTLKASNDFQLDKFSAGSPESFDPYYGYNEDGDIYDQNNQDSLADYIHQHVSGVHFVMADGGFSVEGQENIQEILSKQLYLCQFLTALKILREHGHFVCKLFDLFTPFSVGLVYIMYHCFQQIAIIKPNSSRPANSERYIICKWKLADTSVAIEYLNTINEILNKQKTKSAEELDVLELIDPTVLEQDKEFMNFIIESNNTIGRQQITALRKIVIFTRNQQLKDTRQTEYRKKCLECWYLPDILRQQPETKTHESLVKEILANWNDDKFLITPANELNGSIEALGKIKCIQDWYFVPVGRMETNLNNCSMFLCKSRGSLLCLKESKIWEPVEYKFDISPKSLFYGQIVFEFFGQGRTQTKVVSLHIIDAIMLGGVDIRKLPLIERFKCCNKFCRSINKPFKEGNMSVRSQRIFKLNQLEDFFNEMRHYTLKDNNQRLGLEIIGENKYFIPGGIMLFPELYPSFITHMSKSRNEIYYFNYVTNHSFYEHQITEMKHNIFASFRYAYISRLFWRWTNPKQVELDEDANKDSDILYRIDLQKFIDSKSNY